MAQVADYFCMIEFGDVTRPPYAVNVVAGMTKTPS